MGRAIVGGDAAMLERDGHQSVSIRRDAQVGVLGWRAFGIFYLADLLWHITGYVIINARAITARHAAALIVLVSRTGERRLRLYDGVSRARLFDGGCDSQD